MKVSKHDEVNLVVFKQEIFQSWQFPRSCWRVIIFRHGGGGVPILTFPNRNYQPKRMQIYIILFKSEGGPIGFSVFGTYHPMNLHEWAHEYRWCPMIAFDASWWLIVHHECSRCIMSSRGASWEIMTHHKHPWSLLVLVNFIGCSWVPLLHVEYVWFSALEGGRSLVCRIWNSKFAYHDGGYQTCLPVSATARGAAYISARSTVNPMFWATWPHSAWHRWSLSVVMHHECAWCIMRRVQGALQSCMRMISCCVTNTHDAPAVIWMEESRNEVDRARRKQKRDGSPFHVTSKFLSKWAMWHWNHVEANWIELEKNTWDQRIRNQSALETNWIGWIA